MSCSDVKRFLYCLSLRDKLGDGRRWITTESGEQLLFHPSDKVSQFIFLKHVKTGASKKLLDFVDKDNDGLVRMLRTRVQEQLSSFFLHGRRKGLQKPFCKRGP